MTVRAFFVGFVISGLCAMIACGGSTSGLSTNTVSIDGQQTGAVTLCLGSGASYFQTAILTTSTDARGREVGTYFSAKPTMSGTYSCNPLLNPLDAGLVNVLYVEAIDGGMGTNEWICTAGSIAVSVDGTKLNVQFKDIKMTSPVDGGTITVSMNATCG